MTADETLIKKHAPERFIVFGVRAADDVFVENHTNSVQIAIAYAAVTTNSGYKARIWDNREERFIAPSVIDLLRSWYEHR